MDLKEVMEQKVFAVAGNTLDKEKYACKIKDGLIKNGYTAYGVGKELDSFNDIDEDIDVIDLCINPVRGLELMKECKKDFKCIVIQPGAESDELKAYLDEKEMPYIESCILVGLSLYCR
ncbi:MAG: CoA-binding protein [Eubacteriaceae bacterium]|jgi:predicted CoA-binding protein|nr:CoA-binding protein [Eubacteriaceae bacterium]